ncbi:hypothetical protein SteCoe_20038 [Stentor coeruleus]|uniref:Uncharacterized protein n=1 Tax=Stentor coeruleus TaxID=5963 RepID=A0A1R2BSP1_9CILI|nr:hypothetical protein SteCoe_20038 [Stentor coeruleus]
MQAILNFLSSFITIPMEDEILSLIESEDIPQLNLLLETKSINPNLLTKQGLTLITYAAHHNKVNIIKYLHSIGCNIHKAGKNGENPLTRACSYKRYESIKTLLELGADLNAKYDEYPLVQSLYKDSEELTQFLLDHGADTSILVKGEYHELLQNLSPKIKFILRRHEKFKKRKPFLYLHKLKKLQNIKKLPVGILKELVMLL